MLVSFVLILLCKTSPESLKPGGTLFSHVECHWVDRTSVAGAQQLTRNWMSHWTISSRLYNLRDMCDVIHPWYTVLSGSVQSDLRPPCRWWGRGADTTAVTQFRVSSSRAEDNCGETRVSHFRGPFFSWTMKDPTGGSFIQRLIACW